MTIALDFDGTMVERAWPEVGNEVPYAIGVCNALIDAGHTLVLNTCRCNKTSYKTEKGYRIQAYNWCNERLKKPILVREQVRDSEDSYRDKVLADVYIDDKAVGCPLVFPINKKPYVDWWEVESVLRFNGILPIDSNWKHKKFSYEN